MEQGVSEERPGPRIGVWGTFDLADFGSLLVPRIFAREILRRLPLATVRAFSPLGSLHPVAMDGGLPAEPLGPWSPGGLAELAADLDFVVVSGEIHLDDGAYGVLYQWSPEEAARRQPSRFFVEGLACPMAWHCVGVPSGIAPGEAPRVRAALAARAYVAVRDEISRERLLATGTDREIEVVPDPVLLVGDLFPAEVLARRLRFLRTMGWYPADRAPLLLQGGADLVRQAPGVAEAVRAVLGELGHPPLVLLETDPCRGDGAFLDALAPALPGPVYRMPAAVSLEDVAAALAHARAFAGSSVSGRLAALAYGVPSVAIGPVAELPDALRGAFAPDQSTLKEMLPRIAASFDRLAEIAERSWGDGIKRGERPGLAAMARELAAARERERSLLREREALRARLVEERLRFAEIVDALEATGGGDARMAERAAELRGWVEILEARAARADSGREEAEARLAGHERLLGTRMMRTAAGLQRLLARWRTRE
jgi:hypothetical protein